MAWLSAGVFRLVCLVLISSGVFKIVINFIFTDYFAACLRCSEAICALHYQKISRRLVWIQVRSSVWVKREMQWYIRCPIFVPFPSVWSLRWRTCVSSAHQVIDAYCSIMFVRLCVCLRNLLSHRFITMLLWDTAAYFPHSWLSMALQAWMVITW